MTAATAPSDRTEVLEIAARQPQGGGGRGCGAGREVVIPMPSREDLGTAHLHPPLAWVTLAARPPEPAWQHTLAPDPVRRQKHLSAVWELAVEAHGVQGDLRIPFPCPLLVKGGSNPPEGQTLVGMFAYRLVSGHWRVQTGVAGMGEGEGSLTAVMVIPLATVLGWDQRRAEWADVAWLAMRIHVGKMGRGGRGGATSLTSRGRMSRPPPPAPPRPKAESPPPPKTQPPPLPRPSIRAPPQSMRHVSGPGGMSPSGCTAVGAMARPVALRRGNP